MPRAIREGRRRALGVNVELVSKLPGAQATAICTFAVEQKLQNGSCREIMKERYDIPGIPTSSCGFW